MNTCTCQNSSSKELEKAPMDGSINRCVSKNTSAFTPAFRAGTSDQDIWQAVFTNNEYKLTEFSSNDNVIDVGAHIGAFSCACLSRGARRIIAFEPDKSSFSVARSNISWFIERQSEVTCNLENAAVWRSDRVEDLRLTPVPVHPDYNAPHPAAQCTLYQGANTLPILSVGLDTILKPFSDVTLLKLDCEGAEWPIIFTSRQLHKVNRLCLELHSLYWKAFESERELNWELMVEFGRLTIDDVKAKLLEHGLACKSEHLNSNIYGNPTFYIGHYIFERC